MMQHNASAGVSKHGGTRMTPILCKVFVLQPFELEAF